MASIALGAVGAAIGGGIGGTFLGMSAASLGWMIGSTAGSLLFAPDGPDIEGPRLASRQAQSSAYGSFLKICHGRDRVAGGLIWLANDRIKETKHTEEVGGKGGGGGGTQTTYTYSATCAIAICEGPIQGVRRIWADSVLLYDFSDSATAEAIIASNEAADGITFYYGTDDQEPDPTIESFQGTGNASGYRGTAYVVFDDLQLERFGNRIPNFTFEVIVAGGDTQGPRLIETVPAYNLPSDANYTPRLVDFDGMLTVEYPADGARYEIGLGGELLATSRAYGDHAYTEAVVARLGIYDIRITQDNANEPTGTVTLFERRSANLSANAAASEAEWRLASPELPTGEYVASVYPSANRQRLLVLTGPQPFWSLTWGDRAPDKWYLLDADLQLVDSGTIPSPLPQRYFGACGWDTQRTTGVGVLDDQGRLWNAYKALNDNGVTVKVWEINSSNELVNTGTTTAALSTFYKAIHYREGVCALLTTAGDYQDSVAFFTTAPAVTAGSVTVAAVVSDLCDRAGLAASDYDVSSLTDTIDGYTVSSLRSLRDNIQPLMPVYQFDMAQIDWQLQAVKRGAAPVATITADELAAHEYGQERPDQLTEIRALETDLPKEVIVQYANSGADYQPGLQRAARLSVDTKHVVSMTSPVVMEDDKAKQTAEIVIKNAWTERNRYPSLPLPGKLSRLTPTDVIELHADSGTYTVRLTKVDDHVGLLKCEGVADRAADYSSSATGVPTGCASQSLGLVGPTKGVLLDIPILRDQDDGAGFYAAQRGYLSGHRGSVLYKSLDGGQTYASLLPFTAAAVLGSATDVLADGPTTVIDEAGTVNVQLLGDGELSSVTQQAMLNGSNTIVLGAHGRWEILRFQTATLEADGTYTLSNLLRGLRGTEWATVTHQAGDMLVLLNTSGGVQRVAGQLAELNTERQYKFVTFGRRLAQATEQGFTNTGVGLKPLSPAYVRGSRDSGDNLTISWYARGRIGSGWRVSQDDITGYEVDVLDGSTVVRTISTTDTGDTVSVSYSAANQATDFGSAQSSITVRVYALHSVVGRGYKAEATV